MTFTRLRRRLSRLDPRIEFFTILAWLLFSPWKGGPLYFPIFALLAVLFSTRNIIFSKNVALSAFSYFTAAFNLLLMLSGIFSVYRFKSILWMSDILLVSVYFVLLYIDKNRGENYFKGLLYLISPVSLLNAVNAAAGFSSQRTLFFANPIFQGVTSGLAVVIAVYYLLERSNRVLPVLLVINLAGVYAAQSKAAFLGVLLISSALILLCRKKWIPIVAGIVLLTIIIPNPIRRMFVHSLTKDPYAADRIHIWEMGVRIFGDHFLTGVGAGNFGEVAPTYNFKQTRGPANYFKVPVRPHNDYIKLISETGLAGLLFLLLLGGLLIRKILAASRLGLTMALVLYLLFQAFLLDLLFHTFFFFIFLFLLKNLFKESLSHRSFTVHAKAAYGFLLVVIFCAAYLLPYLSHLLVKSSERADSVAERYERLAAAASLNPLDARVPYLQGVVLHTFFEQTGNPESFYSAAAALGKARRLNPYFIDAYTLESDLYRLIAQKNLGYADLYLEILAPLEKAEQYAPLDPFIQMRKADIYFRFGHKPRAREAALQALALEPDYAAALYFLQEQFQHFGETGEFQRRITAIREKAATVQPEPGTYLFKLFHIPARSGDNH